MADEITCKQGCGKVLTSEGRRVQHELTCKGKPALEGRIKLANPEATPPATLERTKRAPKAKVRVRIRVKNRTKKPLRRVARAIAHFAADPQTTVLENLRERYARIGAAIAALEGIDKL